MKLGVYAIYDHTTEHFSQPVFCEYKEDDSVAIRLFLGMFKPGSMLYDFSEDYTLIFLGEFDDTFGTFAGVFPEIEHEEDVNNVVVDLGVMNGIEAKEIIERKNANV